MKGGNKCVVNGLIENQNDQTNPCLANLSTENLLVNLQGYNKRFIIP